MSPVIVHFLFFVPFFVQPFLIFHINPDLFCSSVLVLSFFPFSYVPSFFSNFFDDFLSSFRFWCCWPSRPARPFAAALFYRAVYCSGENTPLRSAHHCAARPSQASNNLSKSLTSGYCSSMLGASAGGFERGSGRFGVSCGQL